MEGAILGVWTAHGEGRFDFKTSDLMAACENKNLVTVRYVDDSGSPTQVKFHVFKAFINSNVILYHLYYFVLAVAFKLS